MKRAIFLACVVLGCFAMAFMGGRFTEADDKPPQLDGVSPRIQQAASKPPLVTLALAEPLTFTDSIVVTGSLTPREEVLVGPEIDGYRLTDIYAEDGDFVQQNQILARLSPETLETQRAQNLALTAKAQAAIDQVHNQIMESEAALRQAEDAFNRMQPLRQTGVASQAQFDEREAAFKTARARLAAQKEGLRLGQAEELMIKAQGAELDVKIRHTEIRALAPGLISRRTARIGAISSSAAEPLFRIVKEGEIELDAEVPEFYLPRLKTGQRASIEIEGASPQGGVVRLVSSEVGAATRLGRVRIFLGKNADFKLGAFAKGVIDAGQRDAIGVPSTAVVYENETAHVFVVQDGIVHERQVKTGLLTGENIEIKQGLLEGEVVVLRAGSLLRDGDAITPQFLEKKTAAHDSDLRRGALAEVR